MTHVRGNDLLIARSTAREELRLTALQRSMHLYTVGATGSGKSKFLEYLIRQDIPQLAAVVRFLASEGRNPRENERWRSPCPPTMKVPPIGAQQAWRGSDAVIGD